mgnify:CR=1 FL=1
MCAATSGSASAGLVFNLAGPEALALYQALHDCRGQPVFYSHDYAPDEANAVALFLFRLYFLFVLCPNWGEGHILDKSLFGTIQKLTWASATLEGPGKLEPQESLTLNDFIQTFFCRRIGTRVIICLLDTILIVAMETSIWNPALGSPL